MTTKESIIKKHWPRPSQSDSITAWKEAVGKMMDEWAAKESTRYVKWLFDTDCVDNSNSVGLNGSYDIEKTAAELYTIYSHNK